MLEVVICLHESHIENFKLTIKSLNKEITNIKIIVLANKNLEEKVKKIAENIKFYDEDELLEGLNLNKIREILYGRVKNSNRAGWYYQQFLKMAYSKLSSAEHYLIWDSDLILLKKIPFFVENKMIIYTKNEYHKAYFDTLEKLLNLTKSYNFSFICEFMLIKRSIMLEIIEKIEKNFKGKKFYEGILDSISDDELDYCGFSEFETYGTYALRNYKELFTVSKIRSWRVANIYLGKIEIKNYLLKKLAKKYNILSLETWGVRYSLGTKLFENKITVKYLPINFILFLIIVLNFKISFKRLILKIKSKY